MPCYTFFSQSMKKNIDDRLNFNQPIQKPYSFVQAVNLIYHENLSLPTEIA